MGKKVLQTHAHETYVMMNEVLFLCILSYQNAVDCGMVDSGAEDEKLHRSLLCKTKSAQIFKKILNLTISTTNYKVSTKKLFNLNNHLPKVNSGWIRRLCPLNSGHPTHPYDHFRRDWKRKKNKPTNRPSSTKFQICHKVQSF